MTSDVAYQALTLARQANRDIEKHEDICAERYDGINKTMDEIKSILKWAGGFGFTVIITLLGFLAHAQFDANEAAMKALAAKVEAQQQVRP